MKVLYVEPMKSPRVIDTPLETDDIYKLLNTDIYEQCWFFEEDVCLLCDESGWLHENQPLNRHIRETIIKGPFILCCEEKDAYTDLKESYIKKYMEMFKKPEEFVQIGGTIFYTYMKEENCNEK